MWLVEFYKNLYPTQEPTFSTKALDYKAGDTKTYRREPPFKTFEGITVLTPTWLREVPFLYVAVYKNKTKVHSFDVNKAFWEHWQCDLDKIIILVPKKENSVNFIVN